MRSPRLSLVICCYNMEREFPRTLFSLSSAVQNGMDGVEYEIIVVDNGSRTPVDQKECRAFAPNSRVIRVEPGVVSPAAALNLGLSKARAPLVAAMIDGARLASPGVLVGALRGAQLSPRALVLTLAFHLGPKMQMQSVQEGYNQSVEDALLEETRWTEDPYRLFDISVLGASSGSGWFGPLAESNALFMTADMWSELGGFDTAFRSAGGGCVNLDLLGRALRLPGVQPVTLLGEGTFHQVHGGVATNSPPSAIDPFWEEYIAIRGRPFEITPYSSLYLDRDGNLTSPQWALGTGS